MKLGSNDITLALGNTAVDKAYLGTEQVYSSAPSPFPYDAEVEYLQSSGTQYIDTGIVGNLDTIIEVSFFAFDNSQRYILGNNNNSSKAITIWIANSGNQRFGDKTVLYSYPANTTNVVTTSKSGLTVNGVTTARTTTASFSTEGTIFLMWGNGGAASNHFNGKIFYTKIWEGETLIRDFIPVRKAGVGYMYDKVSGELFGNDGTGAFTYGNDV